MGRVFLGKGGEIMDSPIGWDKLFLMMAKLVSLRSKDPNTKVGVILVSPDKRKINFGFNGFISGFKETDERWERPNKYQLVIHGEANAILNAKCDLANWTAYLTIFPCEKCALLLAQAGIKRIVYDGEYAGKTGDIDLAKQILNEAGVIYERKSIT